MSDRNTARELLISSERLRSDLVTAVAKLDSYIEQLKAVMPNKSEAANDEQPPPRP
jgi:uncharacterized coiled-coil protein SlyX